MRVKHESEPTYCESVTAAYQLWGVGQIEKMIQLAIDAHLVVFPDQPRILISAAKGISA